MAAAEARAAWQRVNRYFVQEDAKRAPKFANRQSSTSPYILVDTGPVNTADCPYHQAIGFMPFSGTPYSNLPPDAKWWLHMQPNYVNQRGLNFDHFNYKKTDSDPSALGSVDTPSQIEPSSMGEDSIHSVNYEDVEPFLDVQKNPDFRSEERNVADSKVDQDFFDVMKMTDYYELLEMEMVGVSVPKQSGDLSSCGDSSWMGGEKVPWWRVTGGEELASFVAHKSLLHIENCDLPPPQKTRVRREANSMDHDEIFMTSLECEAISSPSSGSSQISNWSPLKGVLLPKGDIAAEPLRSRNHETPDEGSIPVNEPGKANLLEALCHSQTRAREAEKAAKEAFIEKEHILKLFFKQASQLFAYKQWFKLLQLESENNSSPSAVLPDLLPWMPDKTHKPRNSGQKSSKAKRRKRGSQQNEIGKYAVALAVGVTLVGAGLILGWTVGWLLPSF